METVGSRRRSLGVSACLFLLFFNACGGDDEGKAEAASTLGDGGAGRLDLRGVWTTVDYACRDAKRRESVQVDVFETKLTATKIDGDDCVPAGYVSFEGKLPKPVLNDSELPVTFSFKLYDGSAGDPSSIAVAESGTGKIITPDSFLLALGNAQLRFTRTNAASGGTPASTSSAGASGSTQSGRAGSGGAGRAGAGAEEADSDEAVSGGSGGGGGRGSAGRGGAGGRAASGGGEDEAAGSGGDTQGDEAGSGGGSGRSGSGGRGGSGGTGGKNGGGAAGAGDSIPGCPGPIWPGATCDEVAQCGCKDAENCRWDNTEPPGCFPAGTNELGQSCSEDSECGVGLVCVASLCQRQCRTTDDCSDGGACTPVTVNDEVADGFNVCLSQCEPVLPAVCFQSPQPTTPVCSPCKSGRTCIGTYKFFSCFETEASPLRAPGQACTEDEQCLGGGCIDDTCHNWCREEADCMEPNKVCQKGLGLFANEGDEVGICLEEPISS